MTAVTGPHPGMCWISLTMRRSWSSALHLGGDIGLHRLDAALEASDHAADMALVDAGPGSRQAAGVVRTIGHQIGA